MYSSKSVQRTDIFLRARSTVALRFRERVGNKIEMTLRLFHLQQNCLEAWLAVFALKPRPTLGYQFKTLKIPKSVKTSLKM